jgi:hypothetical protein
VTQQLNPTAPPGEARADPSLGTIPIRLRIAVASDRDQAGVAVPADDPVLSAAVSTELGVVLALLRTEEPAGARGWIVQLFHMLRKPKPAAVELTVISQLASAADRIAVGEILGYAERHLQPARLEAVLPTRREAYLESPDWTEDSRADVARYLDRASLVVEPRQPGDFTGPAADAARSRLMSTCDILLVLWDGHRAGEPGGAAQTLREAATLDLPCVWIATSPDHTVRDNFGPGRSAAFYASLDLASAAVRAADPERTGPDDAHLNYDVLSPLREWLRSLGRYNNEKQPPDLDRRPAGKFDHPRGDESWIEPYFLRAALLAQRYQTRFTWSVWTLTALAIVAAAMLGVHLDLNSSPAWDWAEVASLVTITIVFFILHLGSTTIAGCPTGFWPNGCGRPVSSARSSSSFPNS